MSSGRTLSRPRPLPPWRLIFRRRQFDAKSRGGGGPRCLSPQCHSSISAPFTRPAARMSPRSHDNHADSSSRRLAAIAGQLGSVTSSSVQVFSRRAPVQHTPSRPQREYKHLPAFKELPREGGFPGCAWSVWGKGDTLGTVNLLSDAVVARTAKEEIRTGHAISLNLPAHIPLKPYFSRKPFEHKIWGKTGGLYTERRQEIQDEMRERGYTTEIRTEGDDETKAPVSDEEIHFNSQSGTQWDGLRHFGHLSLNCFYQGIPRQDIQSHYGDQKHTHNFHADAKSQTVQLGIQDWAAHGIVGRGVLLDVWGYFWSKQGKAPYDPCTTHPITLSMIKEVARAQGVRFRQGDILLLRCGYTQRYQSSTEQEREKWGKGGGSEQLAGLEQGEDMLEFLWDNHFAAVASDQPALERWPAPKGSSMLHETILAFFGMPIGELFDLEEVCAHAQKTRRWTFFFSSWPMSIYGGVASPANAAAYF